MPKRIPAKVTVSGAGSLCGASYRLSAAVQGRGFKMTYIPEKGGVPAMQSVIAGKVKAGFNNLSDAYRNQDRLKILGIADLERNDFLPDVKTFKEMGIDIDDSSVNFRGVAFPEGVSEDIINKCADVFPKMFECQKDPEENEEQRQPCSRHDPGSGHKDVAGKGNLPERVAERSQKEIMLL
jgi:tripartite-type tricarboxylate transporter receptor subunit TctC